MPVDRDGHYLAIEIVDVFADHFRLRDFVHFAFYGIEGENWSERRASAFRDSCRGARSFHSLETPRRGKGADAHAYDTLLQWLRDLPKPVGIMVCSDQRGLELLEACLSGDLSVPEEVAVIGVDNDTALCEISEPPLSSIRGGHFTVGFEAARALDALLDGETLPPGPFLVPPNGIVERDSSNIRAIADPVVARGIRFIRERLAEPITNESISRASGLSRTLFQKRFREASGQSIREFILSRRLERALMLITMTDIPLGEVASLCGFRHQEYLGQVVKKFTGTTPGALRREGRK